MTAEITIILLNYRRPGNIPIILDSIRRQTVRSVVFLWNNGLDDVNFPGIDRYEHSSENAGCMVRWKIAKEAETPYVMSLDDDLGFAREDALADIVGSLRRMDDPARIIGPVGCRFGPMWRYGSRREVCAGFVRSPVKRRSTPGGDDRAVDMVKGRAMALRRDQLDGLELPHEREDDIFLSAALAAGRRQFHRIPLCLKHAFRELPLLGVGNWGTPEHLASRDRATATYFLPELKDPGSGQWRPRRCGTIERYEGADLLIRLDDCTGARLNPTAALIWHLCDGRYTEAELLAELFYSFDVGQEILRIHLRKTLDDLVDLGALDACVNMAAVRPHN